MNASAPMTDTERMRAIRARRAAVSSGAWVRAHDGISDLLMARAEMGEDVRLLRFDDAASAAEMDLVAAALDDLDFMIGLVDRAVQAVKAARAAGDGNAAAGEPEARRPNFAAEAGMLCTEGRFQQFLAELHGLERPTTNDGAAQRVRSLLAISSRADLNDDDKAAARWRRLRSQYQDWKRDGR